MIYTHSHFIEQQLMGNLIGVVIVDHTGNNNIFKFTLRTDWCYNCLSCCYSCLQGSQMSVCWATAAQSSLTGALSITVTTKAQPLQSVHRTYSVGHFKWPGEWSILPPVRLEELLLHLIWLWQKIKYSSWNILFIQEHGILNHLVLWS